MKLKVQSRITVNKRLSALSFQLSTNFVLALSIFFFFSFITLSAVLYRTPTDFENIKYFAYTRTLYVSKIVGIPSTDEILNHISFRLRYIFISLNGHDEKADNFIIGGKRSDNLLKFNDQRSRRSIGRNISVDRRI